MEVKTENLSFLHYIGILLALISAVIHLHLGSLTGLTGIGIGFILAGLGFILGVKLILFDYYRNLVYLAGIPFVLGQIIYWYNVNRPTFESFVTGAHLLSTVDKVAQGLLVVILAYLYLQEES